MIRCSIVERHPPGASFCLALVIEPDQIRYRILQLIEAQPDISQRQLAKALGVSLGKTHYLLRALLEKGLVKAGNFRRSEDKLAYAYILTAEGVAARLDMARAFLVRKEAEYLQIRQEIESLRHEIGNLAASSTNSTDHGPLLP